MRRKVVAVVGDGANPHREKSVLVGDWVAQSGHHLLTGGGGGVMEAVSQSFTECVGRPGMSCGIIPGTSVAHGDHLLYATKGSAYPNSSVEIAVFTHLRGEDPQGERSRNHINVLSADLVVALPGDIGTNAEIQLARKYGKPLLLFLSEGETILGKGITELAAEGFTIVSDFAVLMREGNRVLIPECAARDHVRLVFENGVIRSWEWDDAEGLQRQAHNRKVRQNLHDGFPNPYTLRDARRWLISALSSSPESVFAIEADDAVAGGIGVRLLPSPSSCSAEIGYWLGETYWGRGLAANAVRAITQFTFDRFPDLHRLYATVFAWNEASTRVLEKAGYSLEGTMRQSAVKSGKPVDMLLYARTRS